MIKICPCCNNLTKCQLVEKPETVFVRQKKIIVSSKWLMCLACNNDFDDPKDSFDVLKEAYLEYNKLYPNDRIIIKEHSLE